MWRGRTTADYWNMVGPFGGVTAATLLRAVQLHPDVLGEPLALTVNFAGPIEDGEFEVRAEPVRTNNSNQHWTLELRQRDELLTAGTMLTGVRRDTWTDVEATRPEADGPEKFERYLGLPDPDGLDEDDVEAGAVEHAKRLRARPRQSAEVPARGH